jgi:hypothetical protein
MLELNEQRKKQMRLHRLSQINKETLDYVFAKFPHKNEWKKYYVRYHNS